MEDSNLVLQDEKIELCNFDCKLNRFYVYIYLDPRIADDYRYAGVEWSFEYEPKYVGKGQCDRAESHLKGSHNQKMNEFIAELKSIGLKPIIRILICDLFENVAFDIEEFLIDAIGKECDGTGTLLNLTDGGEGASGNTHSSETRQKISVGNKGKVISQETRQKISNSEIGKFVSNETRRKLSKSLKGRAAPNKGKQHSEKSKQQMSKSHKGQRKGQTWEEIYGEEKAKEMKRKASERLKGKTNIEKYGEDKAGELKRIASERKHTTEQRRKNSEANKGKKLSKEHRQKIKEVRKGLTYNEIYGPDRAKEIRKKQSKSQIGKKHLKTKKKI